MGPSKHSQPPADSEEPEGPPFLPLSSADPWDGRPLLGGSTGEQIQRRSREPGLPGPPGQPPAARPHSPTGYGLRPLLPRTLAVLGTPRRAPSSPPGHRDPGKANSWGPVSGTGSMCPPPASGAPEETAPPTPPATQASLWGSAVQCLPPAGHAPFREVSGAQMGQRGRNGTGSLGRRVSGWRAAVLGTPLLRRWTPQGIRDVSGTSPRKPGLGRGAGGWEPAVLATVVKEGGHDGGDRAPGLQGRPCWLSPPRPSSP